MALFGRITQENRFASFVHATQFQLTCGVTGLLSFIIAINAGVLRITKVSGKTGIAELL
jgi:hypothetical protein